MKKTSPKSHFDPDSSGSEKVQIIFSLNETVGALAESLKIFKVEKNQIMIINLFYPNAFLEV